MSDIEGRGGGRPTEPGEGRLRALLREAHTDEVRVPRAEMWREIDARLGASRAASSGEEERLEMSVGGAGSPDTSGPGNAHAFTRGSGSPQVVPIRAAGVSKASPNGRAGVATVDGGFQSRLRALRAWERFGLVAAAAALLALGFGAGFGTGLGVARDSGESVPPQGPRTEAGAQTAALGGSDPGVAEDDGQNGAEGRAQSGARGAAQGDAGGDAGSAAQADAGGGAASPGSGRPESERAASGPAEPPAPVSEARMLAALAAVRGVVPGGGRIPDGPPATEAVGPGAADPGSELTARVHLAEAGSLLALVDAELRADETPEAWFRSSTTRWGEDLLHETRFLLALHRYSDPELARLLEDLELVLIQVARLEDAGDAGERWSREELRIIAQAVEGRGLGARIREFVEGEASS